MKKIFPNAEPSEITSPKRVALTGPGGFLGRTMTAHLATHFPIRTLDVQPIDGAWEKIVGNAANLDDVMALCEGCSHLVIAHMAPNRPEIYDTPTVPFDVNVKGVANLFHAAAFYGIRRVVLVSSTAVVSGHQALGQFLDRDLPHDPVNTYGLTKALQENIAQYYHKQKGTEVAVLRPAHICDENNRIDKYGRKFDHSHWGMIDPRDIAEAVRLALVARTIGYETFYVLGHVEAELHADLQYTYDFLGWQSQHHFAALA